MEAVLNWLFIPILFWGEVYYWKLCKKCIARGDVLKAIFFVFLAIVYFFLAGTINAMRRGIL